MSSISTVIMCLHSNAYMCIFHGRRYDPEQPVRQQHREFLREKVVFREVVPISDPTVRAKIHQTYRIGYLKDVILPRHAPCCHVQCS